MTNDNMPAACVPAIEGPAPDHSQRGHSPLGASGAERWMNCPGSVAMIRRVQQLLVEMGMPDEDDPDYRREGTAQHEAGEHCLTNHLDTWEIVGQKFCDTEITPQLADAVQMYLDYVRPFMEDGWTAYVEFPISSPVHPQFYGSLDFGAVGRARIKVVDYKGGEGITVEAEENPQLMYYAFGIIDGLEREADIGLTFDPDMPVDIAIVQPRAFHVDGPIREWTTTVGEIKAWVHGTLVPAMNATEFDQTLDAGPHCRFCPAKLVCPLLTSLFKAACVANPKHVVNFDDVSLARSWKYSKAVKFYLTALEVEMFRRLNLGRTEGFEGVAKLVPKKSNRVFKPGAADAAKRTFGDDAMHPASIKSPAELEKVSPAAKSFVKEWAYHPDTGLTVAAWDDPKPAVKVQSSTEAFGAVVANLGLTDAVE